MRYAILDIEGNVINCVEWDGITQWSPPLGQFAIISDELDRDDLFDFETGAVTKFYLRENYQQNPE